MVLWGRGGAGGCGPGTGSLTEPWPALGEVRCSCFGVAACLLLFVHCSCCQGWGSQTALLDALYSNSYCGFSLPTAAAGKSGFPQALLPR